MEELNIKDEPLSLDLPDIDAIDMKDELIDIKDELNLDSLDIDMDSLAEQMPGKCLVC